MVKEKIGSIEVVSASEPFKCSGYNLSLKPVFNEDEIKPKVIVTTFNNGWARVSCNYNSFEVCNAADINKGGCPYFNKYNYK